MRRVPVFRLAAVYLAAACLVTWPLAARLASRLGARAGAGDPYLNLWALGWDTHAWLTDPWGVLSGRAFDANIFYPSAATLTYSDHLLLQALLLLPAHLLGANLVVSYNLLLLLSLAASGLAMHVFVRSITGADRGGLVAGLAWACWPYRTAHLLHLQLQASYFLPLALWSLHRLAASRRVRDALGVGVFAALQAISSVYYGVMTAVALVVAAVALAWSTGQWRSRALATRLGLAGLIGIALVMPVVTPYWRSQQREGFGRNAYEAAAHAAALQSYTQVPPDNLVYGRTGLLAPRAPAPGERDRRHVEHQMFPGLVLLGLALVGAWRGLRSDARPVAVAAIAVATTGVVLSLGPEGVSGIYAAASEVVFGIQAIRAPARFAVLFMAGAAVLAGYAASRLASKAIVGLLAAGMLLEYVNAPLPLVAAPPLTSDTGAWLARDETPGPVVYLPLTLDAGNTTAMVDSLQHWRPIVNGYSGQRPSYFTAFVDAFQDPTSLDARTILKDIGVRFVVSASPIARAGEASMPYVERARFGDEVIYEVRWTPASEGALDVPGADDLPALAAVPFADGETTTFAVTWTEGPLDLPAGTIELRTRAAGGPDAPPGAAWRLEAVAETADWVSRFFEARDRFTTWADSQAAPLVHVRSLREGRRSVDRAYVFDQAARRVRTGGTLAEARGESALTLPLGQGSRDALTALWYLRALPIETGFRIEIPVNEAGRGLLVRVTVGPREVVNTPSGPVEAFRVEPRIIERVSRRRPVEATVWLSTDPRHAPVAADIEAGFGRLRLNRVDYQP